LDLYIQNMLLCAITDRKQFPGDDRQQLDALIGLVREWTLGGVDSIQIREKDLAPADMLSLSTRLTAAVRGDVKSGPTRTKVLLNGPPEIALKAGLDGVHLTGSAPADAADMAREIYARAGRQAILSRSCHTAEEAERGRSCSFLLYAPVFEKVLSDADGESIRGKFISAKTISGSGLASLAAACEAAAGTPVLALGGITLENAQVCVDAGAAGVAAIRLFLGDDWRRLRGL
jgi:thiamine-phosphate pyrophosphorylase